MSARQAVIAGVVVLSMASCGSSSSPPPAHATSSPAPSPITIPPLSKTFKSPTMGYSVKYPADWVVTPATTIWQQGTGDLWNDPELDKLDGKSVGLHATSQSLAPGQSAAAWLNAYLGTQQPCGQSEQVPVGGLTGLLDQNGCASEPLPGHLYDLAVVAGGRGYNFAMEGDVDHAFFLAMLATVVFSPQSARG